MHPVYDLIGVGIRDDSSLALVALMDAMATSLCCIMYVTPYVQRDAEREVEQGPCQVTVYIRPTKH